MNIYYLGPKTYSELAARKIRRKLKGILQPLPDIDAVMDATSKEGLAVVAIHNEIQGSILENILLIQAYGLKEIKRLKLPINLCIGQYPGTKERRVYSHSIPLSCCSDYIKNFQQIETDSTESAARIVKEQKSGYAIGRKSTLQEHGLEILAENISNRGINNQTEFVVVKKL
ncbi:MAG TPA: prephenate dehydratase domain-containing protein [Candidatus Nanoarchaeia archaeon]|nr:prephenate dehydratase domain-containing protein [Candidatus Nanoarchaeia archaeon]